MPTGIDPEKKVRTTKKKKFSISFKTNGELSLYKDSIYRAINCIATWLLGSISSHCSAYFMHSFLAS